MYPDLCDAHAVSVYGCEVRDSTIPRAGKGLFALSKFEKGDTVDLYEGKRLPFTNNLILPYGFLVPEHSHIIDAASTQSCLSRLINHDPDRANCCFLRFKPRPEEDVTLVAIITTRDVEKGEELLINYGSQYEKSFRHIDEGCGRNKVK